MMARRPRDPEDLPLKEPVRPIEGRTEAAPWEKAKLKRRHRRSPKHAAEQRRRRRFLWS